jgi:pimeloyl-ACP methyl ester carboxylesterase
MAAHWPAWALIFQLLLAAVLAILLVHTGDLSAAAIAALTVVELCGGALLLAAAPLALAGWNAPRQARRRRGSRRVRALCNEALAGEIALGRMAVEPWRRRTDLIAPVPPRPVLLLHGFACSRAVWRPLLGRLAAAGAGPVRAVSLEPLLADIDAHAGQLLGELEALATGGPTGPITIVAHSMGGLVARAALRHAPPGRIGRLITLGTPHHGTSLACWFGWPSTRQMCPGSDWLARLNASQEGRLAIPVTTLYSLDDNYIIPAASARLEGARVVEFDGLGHLGLLTADAVLERVIAELPP